MPQTKIDACWGCGRPLPPHRLGPNPHQVYHDETCRDLHLKKLEEFRRLNPELPGWGRSPVMRRMSADDQLRVVRAADGRLAVRFETGPAKKLVKEHYGTDTLPISYYLADGAVAEDAAAFLQGSYPNAQVLL